MLTVTNHGPLVTDTNYWGSDLDKAGKVFASVNAGAIRILLPRERFADVGECRSAQYAILSRGPWVDAGLPDGVEILFEDDSQNPFCFHLSPESFDALPGDPEAGREWVLSLWTKKKGRPQKALERPVRYRRVKRIPCLDPWGD